MENSRKKELNISGRKNNESFPFTFFFLQIIVTCAVDFTTQQLWTSEKKKRQFGKHLLRNYQKNC